MSLPPELQVLCRRLASTDPAHLPSLCPSLVRHVQRCESVLSLAVDQKPKDGAPEHSVLVHKLKTQITTLLNNGRSLPGRFAAAILIKAVVDVGGYECLRTSEPWVRGLLTIIQKNDAFPAKDIAIITLTRTYVLLSDFQALAREVASPTLPAFVISCLQLIKSQSTTPLPLRLVETIANALCTLTPLYPTTLRPFSPQIKTAFSAYIAPTAAEKRLVPQSLRATSRRLLVLQHYTTPKNGHADEWARTLAGFVKASHATADQVFRAVQESWESSSGYVRPTIPSEGEAHGGGGEAADALTAWIGLSSGSERLVGLLETAAEFLKTPTKTSVTTPVSAILDLTARITLIVPPQKGKKNRDDTQLNAAIGREEKDELWSILPDIHAAVLALLAALTSRLQASTVPIAADILHQTVRVFDTHHAIPLIREHGYALTHALLLLHGPSMPKLSVAALDATIQSTCRDLLAAAGHAGPKTSSQAPKDTATTSKSSGNKPRPSSNADAYLAPQPRATQHTQTTTLPAPHLAAATTLLAAFLSHLPQQHLKQALRALIDRTAVLAHAKDALVASVLHPYRMRTGKVLASVAPFLARDFPRCWEVEVLLRRNLQTAAAGIVAAEDGDDVEALERMQRKGSDDGDDDSEDEEELDGEDAAAAAAAAGQDANAEMADAAPAPVPVAGFDLSSVQAPAPVVKERVTRSGRAQAAKVKTVVLSVPLKRKEDLAAPPAKRVDTGKVAEIVDVNEGSDSDSDGSVHLNAALEDDSDEEE